MPGRFTIRLCSQRPLRAGRLEPPVIRLIRMTLKSSVSGSERTSRHALRDQDAARAPDVGGDPRRVDRGGRDPAVRVGVELGPLLPADRRPDRAQLRGLDDAGRAGPGDPADPARLPGDRHGLPAPRGAGQHGRHGGHHLRRAAGTRPGRRVEPDGVRRLRHRPAAAARAVRPVRRGRRGHRRPAEPDHHHLRRAVREAHRRAMRAEAGAAAAPADHHRRPRQAAHAAHGGALGAAVERDRGKPGRLAGAQGGPGWALRRDRAGRERDHLFGQRARRPGGGPGARWSPRRPPTATRAST